MDWQPIETAPTERGSKFIGLLRNGRAVTAMPGYYVYGNGPELYGWIEDKGDCLVSCVLAHWMPLPPPPKGDK